MINCKACGELKSPQFFYASNLATCKECVKKRARENRRKRIDFYRAYDKARGSRMSAKDVRRYRAENPEKYKAHCIVNNAVRDGKLNKALCVICGEEKAHGHHDNYAKPLDVVWLCAAHHKERHASLDTLLA